MEEAIPGCGEGHKKQSLSKAGLCKSILPKRTMVFKTHVCGVFLPAPSCTVFQGGGELQKSGGGGRGVIVVSDIKCWICVCFLEISPVGAVVCCLDSQLWHGDDSHS